MNVLCYRFVHTLSGRSGIPHIQVTRHGREREFFVYNLLVRIHIIVLINLSRTASRHGSLNSLFQVALYLPSWKTGEAPDAV